MISRVGRAAFEWTHDTRLFTARRRRVPVWAGPCLPRDLEDRILLSPAARCLLDQARRLAVRTESE